LGGVRMNKTSIRRKTPGDLSVDSPESGVKRPLSVAALPLDLLLCSHTQLACGSWPTRKLRVATGAQLIASGVRPCYNRVTEKSRSREISTVPLHKDNTLSGPPIAKPRRNVSGLPREGDSFEQDHGSALLRPLFLPSPPS